MTLKEQFDAHIARCLHLRNFDWYEAHWMWVATGGIEGKRAYLREANLGGADLRGANLREADLVRANLEEANLEEANLFQANLCGANLCGANLFQANLFQANLFQANLCGANLCGANLCGANLYDAHGIVQFGPCPSGAGRIGYIVAHDSQPMVQLGCWWEPLSVTLDEVRKERSDVYANLIQAAADALAYRQEAGW